MLAKRVIPSILKRGSAQVKGERFDCWRVVGVAEQAARVHASRGVDEIVLLDVAATALRAEPDYQMVRRLAAPTFVPLTVGGGIRGKDEARALLAAGADKVAIGAAGDYAIHACAEAFGSQAVVAILDIRAGDEALAPTMAIAREEAGAGEILLQSVDRDGTLCGYDLELVRTVCTAVSIPVIASGGCSGYEDMARALEAGASAVAAGALFLFTDATPRGAVEFLGARGHEVRVPS